MADIPDDLNKKVTRRLHEQGVEMTPAEVEATRKEAYRKIREAMRARGHEVPDGDLELLDMMKLLGVGGGRSCERCGGSMVHSRLRGYHCFRECQR